MFKLTFAVLAISLLAAPAVEAADFSELLKQIPRDANAVLAIDFDRVKTSPYVRLHGGKSKNPALDLPEGTSKVLVAAKLDSSRDLTRDWEIAIIDSSEPVSVAEVIRTEGGEEDNIAGKPAAWLVHNTYCVELNENQLGFVYPANRQAVTRWVSDGAADSIEVADQLTRVVEATVSGPQIAIALDMRGMPQPHALRANFDGSELLEKHALKVDDIVRQLLGIRGLIFEVTMTDRLEGILRVDFDIPMMLTEKAARDLLLGGLERFGVQVPGLDEWNATLTSHGIQLEGVLTPEALRRILSLVEPPNSDFDPSDAPEESESVEPDVAGLTKKYFDSVRRLIDDLETESAKHKNDSVWFDRYAEKIDRLPILNVDPDMVDFGLKTAETLREMSTRRKLDRARTGAQSSQLRVQGTGTNYRSYTNRWGYRQSFYDVDVDAGRQITANQSISNSRNAMTRIEGFNLIHNAESQLRRTMTERYQMEF